MARQMSTLTVLRVEDLTPHMRRIVLGGSEFVALDTEGKTDSYVKLMFGSGDSSVTRTYTIRSMDRQRREMAIDFVMHGDEGVAGPWAKSVTVGESVSFFGPGGGYAPRPDADWHLLAGDESALPAISAALEALPEGAVAKVFVEIADDSERVDIDCAAQVEMHWVHRGSVSGEVVAGDAPLADAVRHTEWLPGQAQVFIHGEAEVVMHNLRSYVRKDRGVSAEWASISGYWRRGRTEETFREWKRDLARTEAS